LGKSGYLPDISSSFGFWRTFAVNKIAQKDYNGASAGLYNLNGCLTEEYVVTISTNEYEKTVQEQSYFQCDHCTMMIEEITNKGKDDESRVKVEIPTEISYNDVRIFELISPLIDSIISGNKIQKIWICPKCKKENVMNGEWNIITTQKEKPHYFKIVPECPVKKSGLSTRFGWEQKFSQWFYNFLEEVQVSMKQYRIEYISQNGHDMEDSGFKDQGDEKIGSN